MDERDLQRRLAALISADVFGYSRLMADDELAMDVALVSGEPARTVRKNLEDPAAIESFYCGRGALFSSTPEDIRSAQQMFEETIRLEPESSVGYALAAAYYGCGRFEEALDAARFSLEADPNNLDALLLTVAANSALGRSGQAQEAARKVLGLKPDFTIESFAVTHPYKDHRRLEEMTFRLQQAGL
jgi:tetratricopeptide (TPR) repeat protein